MAKKQLSELTITVALNCVNEKIAWAISPRAGGSRALEDTPASTGPVDVAEELAPLFAAREELKALATPAPEKKQRASSGSKKRGLPPDERVEA